MKYWVNISYENYTTKEEKNQILMGSYERQFFIKKSIDNCRKIY